VIPGGDCNDGQYLRIFDYYLPETGHWRAAISPRVVLGSGAPGGTAHNFVTPYDSASEAEAQFAAEQLIWKLQSR
jgi:hypothetical protein